MASKNGARELAESTFTGLNVDPHKVKITPGFNARDFSIEENKEHVEALARSIAEVGVQVPIEVRVQDNEFYLVDGESRLRAALLAIKNGAPIKTIPATLAPKGVSEEDRIASLITRNSGKQLTLLEKAEVFARLQKFGWTDAQIATKTGVTAASVSNAMTLYAAPKDIKDAVKAGSVSATLAIQSIRDHGSEASDAVAEALVNAQKDGKAKATAKHVTAKKSKEAKGRAPFSFNGQEAKLFFGALVDLYLNKLPGNENRGRRQVCIDVFENLYGNEWKERVKEYGEEYGIA